MYNYQQSTRNQYVPMLKGRPVSSIDEARASTIDFDGSIFYFPDLANKRIYTKQINLDGSCTMLMYEMKPIPNENITAAFVTRDEFNKTIEQLKNLLTPVEAQSSEQKPQTDFKF